MYCEVVLDVHSRCVVGWSIDSHQTAGLAANALAAPAFGLVPSMGSIGDFDNAVIESFWGRVQTELFNPRRWKTRIELANALFEYLEILHNRRRRHSALGMLTPIEYEILHSIDPVARTPATRVRQSRGTSRCPRASGGSSSWGGSSLAWRLV
ncbi:MAG: putative transposase [Pseudonocardiales bacterium]|nr:putative transposase [Pseudonocardiales bacterium]